MFTRSNLDQSKSFINGKSKCQGFLLVNSVCYLPLITCQQRQGKHYELKLKDLKVRNYLFQAIEKSIMKVITQKDFQECSTSETLKNL